MTRMSSSYRATHPVCNPTESFWQKDQESHIKNYASGTFPAQADILIIGSGLTGALVAYNLLSRPGPKPSVVMIEARSAASGGHIKPDVYHGFADYQKFHGTEIAIKQCHFERANLQETIKFIQENELTELVDLVVCRSVNVFSTAKGYAASKASYDAFRAAGGNVEGITDHDAEEARKLFRIPDCYGAFSFDAASLWPYKLAIAVLSRALELGLILHTNTSVTEIMQSNLAQGSWTVSTSNPKRQSLTVEKVVHATNGYVSHLLPELDSRVIPLKGHVAAITPTATWNERPWPNTGSIHSDLDYEYIIQRPNAGKHFIIGGGDVVNGGLLAPLGDCDDSTIDTKVADYLHTFPARRFGGWVDKNGRDQGPEPTLVWSGIMGLSKDALPFVGELPGKKGQFMAAGFHGHGMARIFLTAKNLSRVICGEVLDKDIPEVYFDLERRMKDPFSLEDFGLDEKDLKT
ncbi:hypothetical protein BP6252_11177 [Coleophoma cylindrospora]|uniref:FAD dependent oxidoreductase domain-containing protein n=1 Tax=Coleophoma cylindrospora TaxID=1849047 RepID=A0A3D8QPA9_9HELO|nr:hypothetical protein BP6252_11177 [Coleophoma cylindrospora]